MKSFENKIAVITGAGSGIGKSLALRLAGEGAKVAIADIDEDALSQTGREIREQGGEVWVGCFDVANRGAVHEFAETVLKQYGSVDLVINNAGMVMESLGIEELEYDDFERVMNVNLWGVVNGSKAFIPHLLKQSEASLVNVSSVYGLTAKALQTAYSTSKFAVRGFSEAIRQELRDTSVTVTVVFPGGVKTNLVRNTHLSGEGQDRTSLDQLSEQLEKVVRTTAAEAADVIIEGIKNKATRVLIGEDARFFDMVARRNPGNYGVILEQHRARRMAAEHEENESI